jgi:hypothetical protein
MALWYGVSRLPGLRRLWPWTDQRFYSHADLRHLFARVGADGVETHVSLLAPAWAGVIIGTIRKPGGAAESRVTHAG